MTDMGFDTTTWTQDSKSKATNDVTTTTSQTLSGTLTAGYVKLSNNVLQASDGGNTITLDDDDNVGIAGDLTVSGNNISGSGGGVITFSGDDIRFADNVSLPTDDSKISFGVNGEVNLAHHHNQGLGLTAISTVTDTAVNILTLNCFTSNTAADNIGGGVLFQIEDDGGDISPTGAFYSIMTDASAGTENSDFSWFLTTDGSSNERMRLTDAGNLQIDGDLTVSGSKITFGNGAVIDNETSTKLYFQSESIYGFHASGSIGDLIIELVADGAGSSEDINRLRSADGGTFYIENYEGASWSTSLSVDKDGNTAIAGDLTVTGNLLSSAGNFKVDSSGDVVLGTDVDDSSIRAYSTARSLILAGGSGTIQGTDNSFIKVWGGANPAIYLNPGGSGKVQIGVTNTTDLVVSGKFACNGQTPAAAPNWTLDTIVTDRSITGTDDISGHTLGTLIQDLIDIGILQ